VSDIDTAGVVSLKALDPNRPIREADVEWARPDALVDNWLTAAPPDPEFVNKMESALACVASQHRYLFLRIYNLTL
jgi:hypothetical protein